jgi:sulfopropanediol 3-dehydrogenase
MVEQILADVDAHKDAAVRELSQKFDNWSPTSFKLAPSEVERATGKCPSAISTTLERIPVT